MNAKSKKISSIETGAKQLVSVFLYLKFVFHYSTLLSVKESKNTATFFVKANRPVLLGAQMRVTGAKSSCEIDQDAGLGTASTSPRLG